MARKVALLPEAREPLLQTQRHRQRQRHRREPLLRTSATQAATQAARAGGNLGLGIGGASIALCATFSCASRDLPVCALRDLQLRLARPAGAGAAVTAQRRRRTAGEGSSGIRGAARVSGAQKLAGKVAAFGEKTCMRASVHAQPPRMHNARCASKDKASLFMDCFTFCFCQLPLLSTSSRTTFLQVYSILVLWALFAPFSHAFMRACGTVMCVCHACAHA